MQPNLKTTALGTCYSKCVPWTSSKGIPWELVTKTESQAPPWTRGIRIHSLTWPLGDFVHTKTWEILPPRASSSPRPLWSRPHWPPCWSEDTRAGWISMPTTAYLTAEKTLPPESAWLPRFPQVSLLKCHFIKRPSIIISRIAPPAMMYVDLVSSYLISIHRTT